MDFIHLLHLKWVPNWVKIEQKDTLIYGRRRYGYLTFIKREHADFHKGSYIKSKSYRKQ